jgi:hypothetical protein
MPADAQATSKIHFGQKLIVAALQLELLQGVAFSDNFSSFYRHTSTHPSNKN